VLSNDWFWPKVPHGSQELLDENRQTVQRFSGSLTWRQDDGDPRRTADQIHLIAERVPLRRAYEDLLSPLRFTGERDSQLFTGAMLQMVPDGRRPTNRALPPVRAGGWRQRCLPRAPVVIPVAVPPSSDIWRGLSPPWRAPWTTRSRPRQANEPAASARARRAMPPRDASVHPVTEQYSDSSRPT
jgi:hypothetical protein